MTEAAAAKRKAVDGIFGIASPRHSCESVLGEVAVTSHISVNV